jgi:glucokinase
VQHCYAPERIVMGGGIAALLDLLQSGIEASQRAGLLPGFRPAEIRAAALGDDAGLVGAAMVAMGEPPAA